MNLRQLEIFRAVMETGSVKGAAELLHLSPPAVSKLLATLERRSNLLLFERLAGRLVATPEAKQLYSEVGRLWKSVERVQRLAEELAEPSAGSLHLAISPSLGATVVPRVANRLCERIPDVELNVDLLIPHLLIDSLIDGVADLGLSLSSQMHPSLEICASYPVHLVCVMPRGHELARFSEVTPAQLVGQRVISYPQALLYGITERDLYGRYADKVVRNTHVRSGQTACWFSLAGGGIAIVDNTAVAANAFPELDVRPYRCRARLALNCLRHRHKPLSQVAMRFLSLFDASWEELVATRER